MMLTHSKHCRNSIRRLHNSLQFIYFLMSLFGYTVSVLYEIDERNK